MITQLILSFYSILQAIWSPYEGNPLLRSVFSDKSF